MHPETKFQQSDQQMEEQLKVFRSKLEEFALKHRKGIAKDPEFRSRFVDMCTKIGVDPLACIFHPDFSQQRFLG